MDKLNSFLLTDILRIIKRGHMTTVKIRRSVMPVARDTVKYIYHGRQFKFLIKHMVFLIYIRKNLQTSQEKKNY